jgi:FtsP/CotA-like multicopper oxidase with cupredoxin domain
MSKILQFQVSVPIKGRDDSCNPAEGKCKRPAQMVRLADGNGNVVKGLKINKVRQLTLKEQKGAGPPGGMVEVMLNNTKWDGQRSPGIAAIFQKDGVSELPRQGSVEMWEIINLTMEAHPIHTHLTQFQVVNRQEFTGNHATLSGGYYDAWGAAFGYPDNLPAGCKDATNAQNPCPAYGPPLPYTTPNAEGAIGGNPAVGPYLTGTPIPPDPAESGWKDVARAYPGQVLRLLVRWTPSYVPQIRNKSYAGKNLYSFDPTAGPGYVWHCHIIDHEDNEMMRPYKVTK